MNRYYILNNGVKIPSIGYGTWKITSEEEMNFAVSMLMKYGYNHLDTASRYENQKYIGTALKKLNINRNDIFITSKLWTTDFSYNDAILSCKNTLKELDIDHLDLFLLHWPYTKEDDSNYNQINLEAWKALEYLYQQGMVKAIGVSNFSIEDLKNIIDNANIKPMINQIEFNPSYKPFEIMKFCQKENILVQAWSPLGHGEILNNQDLKAISKNYNKSVAQIIIRWLLQHNLQPIPKSLNENRIKENIDIFNFELSKKDMDAIDKLNF